MINHTFNNYQIICHLDLEIIDQENMLTLIDNHCDLFLVMEYTNNELSIKRCKYNFHFEIDYDNKIIEIK